MHDDFSGSKIALFLGDHVLVYQRDDFPGLRYAGMWDLPGGGREGDETPLECALRETEEEFGFRFEPAAVVWHGVYPSADFPGQSAHFFVATITEAHVDAIVFGDEGQRWEMVHIDDLLAREDFVPRYRERIGHYLAARSSTPASSHAQKA
ncbi:MAG: NUDIX domain-containing protein [Alphaproteobacteria bacterium]|nr:NUDIX domain-containing protein [Alphaproteobacteria bacterium]